MRKPVQLQRNIMGFVAKMWKNTALYVKIVKSILKIKQLPQKRYFAIGNSDGHCGGWKNTKINSLKMVKIKVVQ